MTATATETADPAAMRPLFFEGRFGWLHGKPAQGGTGVVICSALAQEEVCTRYGAMLLADRFARGGRPTLRFDYRGTGDSVDSEVSIARLTADIGRAVDCLRQEARVDSVILCGFRFGALLAAMAAAERTDVAGLALLAPVLSGAAYVRDLKVSHRFSPLAELDPVPPAESPAPLNTNGFHWSRAFRDAIAGLDLAALPAPAVPTLIALHHGGTRGAAMASAWHAAGTPLSERDFADYPAFMRDPTTHVMPEASFAAVAEWVSALPAPPRVTPARPVRVTDRLVLDEAEEIPLRLGEAGATFGMLCRPRGPVQPVAALMLHEGSSHHIGNGGAQVPLARRLAAQGYASLRLDLSGMGDSPCAPGRRRPFSDPARLPEVIAAADALADLAPGGIVASGLCSGAEMAFHAALADHRLIGTVLVNMPAIGWDPLAETDGAAPPAGKRTLRSYGRAIRAGGLRRVMRGDVDLLRVAGALTRHATSHVGRRLRSVARRGDPEAARVRRQMNQLAGRGVETLFVFSDDDPGLPEVRAQLAQAGVTATARIEVFDRSDHHFNSLETRRRYDALYARTLHSLASRHVRARPSESLAG
jgi:pimeloyl-ACP methyl ester carboxylesterase